MVLIGVVSIFAQHAEARFKEEAAEAAKKKAAEDEARRKQLQASLLAEAPAKATEWSASLKKVSDDIASIKTNADLHARQAELTALRDQSKQWLDQLDTKPPVAVAAESEIESTLGRLQPTTDFVDGVAAFETAFQNAKALIAKHSWIEADEALDDALRRLSALEAVDPSFRAFVAGGFDPDRKKTQVAASKAGIAGVVAAEKKRAAAEEAARVAEQAYAKLCGEAPSISSWDGAWTGLESTIKESANDPSSIDVSNCTQPILTKDKCWLSTCNVRGKNGFGALILQRQTWSYSKALGFRPND